MPKILLAGQDVRLLETRAAVLRKTGAEVIYCFGPEARKAVASETPELLVLCHSLMSEEAETIADAARSCCPKIRILLVVSQKVEQRRPPETKFDATSLPDPAHLIARATELLRDGAYPVADQTNRDRQGSVAL